MTILVLGGEYNWCKMLASYALTLRRRKIGLVWQAYVFPLSGYLHRLLDLCLKCPSLLLRPESDFPHVEEEAWRK